MLIASGLVSRVKQNYSSQSWPSSASASSLLGSNIISIISIIRRWNQEPVRLRLCGINWHISELSGPHYDFQQLPLWHSSWSKETKGSLIFGYRWSNVSPIQPEIPRSVDFLIGHGWKSLVNIKILAVKSMSILYIYISITWWYMMFIHQKNGDRSQKMV